MVGVAVCVMKSEMVGGADLGGSCVKGPLDFVVTMWQVMYVCSCIRYMYSMWLSSAIVKVVAMDHWMLEGRKEGKEIKKAQLLGSARSRLAFS